MGFDYKNRDIRRRRVSARTPTGEPPPLLPESRLPNPRRLRTRSRSPLHSNRSRTPPRTPSRTRSSNRETPKSRILATPRRESRPSKRQNKAYHDRSRSSTPHHYRRDSRHRPSRSSNRRELTEKRDRLNRPSSSRKSEDKRCRLSSNNKSPLLATRRSRSRIQIINSVRDIETREVIPPCSSSRNKHDLETGSATESNSLLEKLVNVLSGSTTSQGVGIHAAQNVIPDFDPHGRTQTMREWLAKIDESAHVYGWSERQTIFYALPKLRGLAKRWYDGLTSVKYTWAEWRDKLIEAFPCESNYADILSEMLARKTRGNETLEEYYYDKIMLINRCELSGKKAVDCLTQGIYDPNIRMNVQGANLQDPECVLRHFRNITSRLPYLSRPVNQKQQPSEQSIRRNVDTSSNKQSVAANVLTCFNCGEVGHRVSRCTKTVIKCSKCGRFGHEESNCKMGGVELRNTKESVAKSTEKSST